MNKYAVFNFEINVSKWSKKKFVWVMVGSTQLCGHTNFVFGWSWAVTKIGIQNLDIIRQLLSVSNYVFLCI